MKRGRRNADPIRGLGGVACKRREMRHDVGKKGPGKGLQPMFSGDIRKQIAKTCLVG